MICMSGGRFVAIVIDADHVAVAYLKKKKASFSPLFTITQLSMGAESCEKSESLQTFFATFVMYALYGSKKLRKKFGNFHFRQ